jgi:NifU-like protein
MSVYPEQVNRAFLKPSNVGRVSRLDALGTSASITCGAVLQLSISIDDKNQTILEAQFRAAGCGFLFAASSVLTDAIVGLKPGEALQATAETIESVLGPPLAGRSHCFELCYQALENAALDFRSHRLEERQGDDPLVCTCFGITEAEIEKVIARFSPVTVQEVTSICNAGAGCGSCQPIVQELLDFGSEQQPRV